MIEWRRLSHFPAKMTLVHARVLVYNLKVSIKDPSTVFLTFDRDKLGQIRRHHWKQRLKISTIAKFENDTSYCAFHKHGNSKVQKPPSQLRFSLPSIIITITSNEPWNTETHKTDRNPPITNHKRWPFEPVKVKFCFQRGPLRWLTAAKNAIVNWLLNFRIRMFVKSAVSEQRYSSTWRFKNLQTFV